jgi:hypothetical protein
VSAGLKLLNFDTPDAFRGADLCRFRPGHLKQKKAGETHGNNQHGNEFFAHYLLTSQDK